jgi:hypothetical protein
MISKLSLIRAKGYAGFSVAEVARIQYQKNMNQVFSCALISSRLEKLTKLEEIITKKNKGTDIMQKLEKERDRYTKMARDKSCNADDQIVDRLIVSASTEYCRYTYYLDYLDARIRSNLSESLRIDATISGNTGSMNPNNTDDALKRITSRLDIIAKERARAQDTAPKAVLAFQEMDRTYIIHLLLVIIYDDYLELRENLNTYLSIVSQTFEKAYNAQDTNTSN